MARDELVTENIWEDYSQKIQDRINNPINMGELTQEDANKENAKLIVSDFGSESSGNTIRLFWLVDESTDTIINSKFKSFGSGLTIASSDAMTELCIGKKVNDVTYITDVEVESFLRDNSDIPAFPANTTDFIIGNEVIVEAAAQYKGISKNDMLNADIVCACTKKSRKEIIDVIKENNITAVEDIIRKTAAGAYCKSCVRPGGQVPKDVYLVDILDEVKETMKEESKEVISNDSSEKSDQNATLSTTDSFDKMTIVQRIKAVDAVIDEFIRPMLVMDGGDMEIIDIKENIPHYDIYIRYLGACGSCASGTTGTLYAIETTLQQKIDENIRVLPV